ncbi:MAG: hypothetical protein IT392_09995 [Nitrospirae bacterium]|nr:hypothetical protein [Nitrospirota bacterium]
MDSEGGNGTVDSAGGSGGASSERGAILSLSDDSSADNLLPIEMESIKKSKDTNVKILDRFILKFNTIGKDAVLSRINKRFTMAKYERSHEGRHERNVSY